MIGVPAAPAPADERWQVRDLAPGDRVDGWRDVVARTHLPWDVAPPPADLGRPFDAVVRRRRFGDVALLDCRCDPCAGGRAPRTVRATSAEWIGVLTVLSGSEVLEQDGRQIELRAGDAALWDSTRPARFAVREPLRKRTILLPRDLITERLRARPERWTCRVLPRHSLAAELLRHHAELLARPRPPSADETRLAARLLVELVGAAAEQVVDGDAAFLPEPSGATPADVRRSALLQAVLATVDARLRQVDRGGPPLQPGELRPTALAHAHAVSVRTLHQLAEATGESLAGRTRRLRLEHARHELQRADGGTISAVAHRWGFADAAHFTRAYKNHFGERPTDTLRRSWADLKALGASPPPRRGG